MVTQLLPAYDNPCYLPLTPSNRLANKVDLFSHSVDFRGLLQEFEPTGLASMDSVALLDRTDTKYVLRASQLWDALAALRERYWVLDIGGVRLHRYRTLYFDTADFALYMQHHAGRSLRHKVRSRQYVDSRRSFLEIKLRTHAGRTSKRRIETRDLVTSFGREASAFVGELAPIETHTLQPRLWNRFGRITLVSKHAQERLTLDLSLSFGNEGQGVDLPGVAVAEVKQAGLNRRSDFVRQMRAMGIHPTGFSKYCIGTAMLYPAVKHNNFKDQLRLVERLIREESHVYGTH